MSSAPLPSVPMPDLAVVARTWGLAEPLRAVALPAGTNNLVLRLETGAGVYALRVYRNTADPARLAFEGNILRWLRQASLPVAVPVPLLTTSGQTLAALRHAGGMALAVLEPFLPGTRPDERNLALAEDAGAALASLDRALAAIPEEVVRAAVTWRSYGDLEHCHPLVPAPRAAIAELHLSEDVRARLLVTYDRLMDAVPTIYASLPQQLAHEDYAPTNTLAEGERISAILDFEFCSRDVRAMDLTVALSWWPGDSFGTGGEWPILRAFARGYGRVLRLTFDEVVALPTLYLLRAYTSLLHRLGRARQGLSSLDAVLERVTAALEREDWLRANAERLVALLADEVGPD